MPDIKIKGLRALHRDIEKLTKSMSPDQLEKASKESAEIIRKEVYKRAPRGPTGNLKKSIVKKLLYKKWHGAAYIAAVDRKVAPHTHLAAFGSSRSSPQPFIRKGVEAKAGAAARKFRKELENMVNKAVR